MNPSTKELRSVLTTGPFGMNGRFKASAMPRLLLPLLAALAGIGPGHLFAAAPVAPPDLTRSHTVGGSLVRRLDAQLRVFKRWDRT